MNDHPETRRDLLDAVDTLTLPQHTRVLQDVMRTKLQPDGRPAIDPEGNPIREVKGTQLSRVTHDPLLTQLERAIATTIGAGAGRAMLERHALSVLDSDALYRFTLIATEIGEWCRLLNVQPSKHPATDLRRWYVARLATNPESDDWYIDKLRSWAGMIRGKLNPWQNWEITDPCPKCHATTWMDESEDGNGKPIVVERNRPVLVEYPVDRDILTNSRATCRNCGHEWVGESALRELRWDIDHPETHQVEA